MSNSPLVSYTKLSPNYSQRTLPIGKVTLHHMAGNGTLVGVGADFARPERKASANYAIDSDGNVALYVDEKYRAWTSSSSANDNVAVTVEVANDGGAPDWHVSDKALNALIELCVDICKRNNMPGLVYTGASDGTLTRHNMFAATACPGPYLQSKFPYIAEQVNLRLKPAAPEAEAPKPPAGWAQEACAKAVKKEIFKGDENGDYHWRDGITRQEIAVLLDRLGRLEPERR